MDREETRRELRLDEINLDSTYFTDEGYLIDSPIVTTVGVFEYKNPDGTKRRELRRPEDVFDPESLASFLGKPVLFTHAAGLVDKTNASKENIGTITSIGREEGDNVRCDIVIHNTEVLEKYGYRALSLGYTQTFVEEPGVWNGQPYDGYQTNIRINHLALVRKARAGENARLNIDSADEEEITGGITMSNPNDKKRIDEGTDPVIPPAAADETAKPSPEDVVKSIRERQDRRDSAGIPTDPEAASACIAEQAEDINTLLSAFDGMMAQRDFDSAADKPTEDTAAEPPVKEGEEDPPTTEEENKDAVGAPAAPAAPPAPGAEPAGTSVELKVSMDSIDRMVSERLSILRVGDKLNLDGLESMPIREAKAAIVKAVRPGMRMDGVSDDYINAAYDMAVAAVNGRKSTDIQREQMAGGRKATFDSAPEPTTGGSAADRRNAMINRNQKRKDVE